MSSNKKQIEEQVFDTLLVETLGNIEPPDLTEEILTRLACDNQPQSVGSLVTTASQRVNVTPEASTGRHLVAWGVVAAVLAASVLMLVWLRGDQSGDVGIIAANERNTRVEQEKGPVTAAIERAPEVSEEPAPRPRPRGIPLVLESVPRQPNNGSPIDSLSSDTHLDPLPEITLVSRQVDLELKRYWSAVGIEPSSEADAAEVASRLAQALGVSLPQEAVTRPEDLQAAFASAEVAQVLADRWLRQITEKGSQRLNPEQRRALTEDLAKCFEGKQPLDRTLADWLDGRSPQSSSFYAAVSFGGQDAMARRLAAVTMNADLRCIRCHDATIEGQGHQNEYWSFLALLKRGIARGSDGQLTIDPEPNKSQPLFYELSDGRQRLAEPLVSSRWFGSPIDDVPVDTIKGWTSRLEGSQVLARGTVNSLWQLVHGQPLQGRVVDPITAPHNAALDQIEDDLVQDLIQSQFNIGRTLSLIVASPATRRAVPSSLLPENALVATDADKRKAIDAVNAFAAALPRRVELSLAQRVDQAVRAIGGKLDQDGRSFVAQVVDGANERPGGDSADGNQLAADFPVRSESLPVQWLTLIENEQSQIDHLGYLAGIPQLPENVRSAVKAMQENEEVSQGLMLNRLWWLVNP